MNDFNLDDLLDRVNANASDTVAEEIPEPGAEGNPWIGFNHIFNGQRRFHALSGRERRRVRRANERADAAEQRKGERAYNRRQRQQEFAAGTVRQQMRILREEIPVTDDMMANLQSHILRQTRLNVRAELEPQRREHAEKRRSERLHDRRIRRADAGKSTHRDLVALGMR